MGLHTGVALRAESLLRLVGVEVLLGAGGQAAGFSVVHHCVLYRVYSFFLLGVLVIVVIDVPGERTASIL